MAKQFLNVLEHNGLRKKLRIDRVVPLIMCPIFFSTFHIIIGLGYFQSTMPSLS